MITFLIKCPDQRGITAKITSFFYDHGFNIVTSQQYTNVKEVKFFMRIRVECDNFEELNCEKLESDFSKLAETYKIEWSVDFGKNKTKVAIMVSHTSHNLYDLLYKHKEGKLNCEIKMIISNHDKLKDIADMFNIPFHHKPIAKDQKLEQEKDVIECCDTNEIDLIILARYMQILSADFVKHFENRVINIHHSFLPAFQGANPYKRAYERGVKLIGATAHYANEDLDEGPIIEQGVERVTHECTPSSLKSLGAEIETMVLSRAVKCHLDNRVIVDGVKAVVFPEVGA